MRLVIALPRATEIELVERTTSGEGVSAVARAATSVLVNVRFQSETRAIPDSKYPSAVQFDLPMKFAVRAVVTGFVMDK